MVNILDTIIATKFEEIKESKKFKSLDQLKDEVKGVSQPRGFVKAIETQLAKNKAITTYMIKPTDLGFDMANLETIQVENVDASKAMMLDVLNGNKGPHRDITLLNAGAAIYVSGLSSNLKEGIEKAASVIDQGLSLKKLEALKVASHD